MAFHQLIPWIGKHLLHLPYDIVTFTNGSGDTTYDYVLLLTLVSVSVFTTLVWSMLDRKNKNYTRLYYWLFTGIRYYLALTLISYGLVKVFKSQFPAPGLFRLTETYGESSPMGLAWTFLGFSKGYNIFMGILEISALLLLFRRTMTLGAIICLMATLNVMAINYFFDVPVKIISTSLVLMSVVLLLNDAVPLLKLFFTKEAVTLNVLAAPEINNKWLRNGKKVLKVIILLLLVYSAYDAAQYEKMYGDNAPASRLYGIYTLQNNIEPNDTLSKHTTDSVIWKQLIVEKVDFARIRFSNDSVSRFMITTDTVKHKFDMVQKNDTTEKYSFAYSFQDVNKLLLTGKINKENVQLIFTKTTVDINSFPLINRGFHWINEYPYNK